MCGCALMPAKIVAGREAIAYTDCNAGLPNPYPQRSPSMSTGMNRRHFMQSSAAAVGYFYTATAMSAERAASGPNGKIAFAGIGVGGKGSSDVTESGKLGEIVA